MSQDADLLKSLRQASIDYTALQLRFLHEYKGVLGEMLGPAPEHVVESKDAPEHRHPNRTTLSDILYESARYSMATYAHWLQMSNKQLDFLVDALGAGRGDKRHGLYRRYEETITVREPIKPGNRVVAEFKVNNPYPFEASASFETVFLCEGEARSPLEARFSRSDGKNGRDYSLPASGHGVFEVAIDTPRSIGGGKHKAETTVAVDGRQGCCLAVAFTVTGPGGRGAKGKKAAKKARKVKAKAKRKAPAKLSSAKKPSGKSKK